MVRWAVGVIVSVGAAVLLGAGAAAAHDGAVATTAPVAGAPSGMPATGPSPAAEPVMPAPRERTAEFRAAYLLAAVGVTAAAAFLLRVALPLLTPGAPPRPADSVAAAALLFAGVAHCTATASHWAEAWHLGAFFALSGLLLLAQGVVVWLRPSVATYGSVVASTAAFIVLYVLAREFSLPLVGHRDPYVFEEYPVKVAEGVAAVLAVTALARARPAVRRSGLAAA